MASQTIHGSGNVQVLIKDSPHGYVHIGGRQAADLWVPAFRRELDARNKDLDLLLARYAITDLAGRDSLWQDCLAWCDSPGPVSIRCITGPGGAGKTRLALELVHAIRLRPEWDARFVHFELAEPLDLWADTRGAANVLLVFDYAPDVVKPLAESLRRLTHHAPDANRKLRVLLLARTASWDEGWLASLKSRSTIEDSIETLFDPVEPIRLEALGPADRVAVFAQALRKAAAFAGVPEPTLPDPALFREDRAEKALRDPLTLIMAAVVAVRNGVPNALSLTRTELAYEAADLLVARRLADAFPENEHLAHHLAAFVTLCGGLSKCDARAVLAEEAVAGRLGTVSNPGGFIDRLQAWFPGEKTEIGPILPDIVSEAFLLGKKQPRLEDSEAAVLRAVTRAPWDTVAFLIRAAQDFCLTERDPRHEPLAWLGRIVEKGEADDAALLTAIEAALPQSTVVLRPLAVHVTGLVLSRLERLRAASLDAETEISVIAGRAGILNNLAFRQSGVGERALALATIQEAVALRRELARRNRDAFLPGLASSLNNLAIGQSDVGARAHALVTAQEATGLYRELAHHNRDAFLPDLAMSLNNLANMQSDVGDRLQAHGTTQEALALYRELAHRNRDAFLPELARSLNNHAVRQSNVGDRVQALAIALEALALYRELAHRNRDAFLPDLASSLNNLANMQSDVGDRLQALATAQEATGLYRELAHHNRDAFLPELARSLNNLANVQIGVGNRAQALATVQEAVALRRELAHRNRDAFLPGLALSLNNLANMQSEVGEHVQALATAQEALALYRELTLRNRDAFAIELARVCGTLGTAMAQAQRNPEAAEAFSEGLRTLFPYAERYRDALRDFGVALLRDYAASVEAGQLEFDGELVAEAIRILELDTPPPGDS